MVTRGVSISARSWLGTCSVYTAAVMLTTLAMVAAVTKVWRPLLSCSLISVEDLSTSLVSTALTKC